MRIWWLRYALQNVPRHCGETKAQNPVLVSVLGTPKPMSPGKTLTPKNARLNVPSFRFCTQTIQPKHVSANVQPKAPPYPTTPTPTT